MVSAPVKMRERRTKRKGKNREVKRRWEVILKIFWGSLNL